MWFLWIYMIGLIVIPLIFGYLNRHYKWIRKSDVDADLAPIIVFGLALWPLSVIIAIIGGALYGFNKYFIPD